MLTRRPKPLGKMMSSLEIGLIILFTIFSGAVLGMLIGAFLPEHHLSGETKSAISVSMAVVGTLTALVLGLLISNASSSFSTRNSEVTRISADKKETRSISNANDPNLRAGIRISWKPEAESLVAVRLAARRRRPRISADKKRRDQFGNYPRLSALSAVLLFFGSAAGLGRDLRGLARLKVNL